MSNEFTYDFNSIRIRRKYFFKNLVEKGLISLGILNEYFEETLFI